jgi:hypothetical protein
MGMISSGHGACGWPLKVAVDVRGLRSALVILHLPKFR